MSKISKTTNVNTIHSVDKSIAKPIKSPVKPSEKAKLTNTQLRNKIKLLVDDSSLSQTQLKEKIIHQIIEWQFGESALTNHQFKSAYNKLLEISKHTKSYQSMLDELINQM